MSCKLSTGSLSPAVDMAEDDITAQTKIQNQHTLPHAAHTQTHTH